MKGGPHGIRKGLISFLLISLWVFVSHAQEAEKREVEAQINKSLPPIKRYPLEQFRLVGIVWVGEQPKAMVVDPEKNTHFLGVGDEIGSKQGKIIEVRESGIMVEEKKYFEDVFGKKKVETVKSVLAFREE